MRILKPIFYTAVVTITFASCKSVSSIPVPTGHDTVVNITEKKAPLTEEEKNSWGHLDLATDSIPGMSVEKAYQFLAGKKGKMIVVGVVDSGTDLQHEDLKDVAWVNPKEITGNGIDDDKNGYIDDINGWNFLGPIYKENLEAERILKNPKLVDEAIYKEVKEAHDKKVAGAKSRKERFGQMLAGVTTADNALSKHLNKETYTKEEVLAIETEDASLLESIGIAKQMYGFGLSSLSQAIEELTSLVDKSADLLSGDTLKKDYRGVWYAKRNYYDWSRRNA